VKKFYGRRHRASRKEPTGTLEVRSKRNESAEDLCRRFKRACKQSGLLDDIRKSQEPFKSKSDKKREKHSRAIKRAKKQQMNKSR
tara:strand:- start:1618 stop:1872 length:255 start_codon:yes stop_codon:yes gene_type:complete